MERLGRMETQLNAARDANNTMMRVLARIESKLNGVSSAPLEEEPARHRPDSPRTPPLRQTRADRPRSFSEPPNLGSCDWHGGGNVTKQSLSLSEGCECVTDPHMLHGWYSHMSQVLFFDKLNWLNCIYDAVVTQIENGNAVFFKNHSGSWNNRKFIIRCTKCGEMAAVAYGPDDFHAARKHRIEQILKFLMIPVPTTQEQ